VRPRSAVGHGVALNCPRAPLVTSVGPPVEVAGPRRGRSCAAPVGRLLPPGWRRCQRRPAWPEVRLQVISTPVPAMPEQARTALPGALPRSCARGRGAPAPRTGTRTLSCSSTRSLRADETLPMPAPVLASTHPCEFGVACQQHATAVFDPVAAHLGKTPQRPWQRRPKTQNTHQPGHADLSDGMPKYVRSAHTHQDIALMQVKLSGCQPRGKATDTFEVDARSRRAH
jgi:hypothetical protein